MKCQSCGTKKQKRLNQVNRPKKKQDYGKLVCDECFKELQKEDEKYVL